MIRPLFKIGDQLRRNCPDKDISAPLMTVTGVRWSDKYKTYLLEFEHTGDFEWFQENYELAKAGRQGAWVAYYADWSGAALFNSELEALRYAVERTMAVKFVGYGEEII